MTDEEYRGTARQRLEEFAHDAPAEHREALLSCLRYRALDLSAPDLPEKVGAVLKEMGAGDGGKKARRGLPGSATEYVRISRVGHRSDRPSRG